MFAEPAGTEIPYRNEIHDDAVNRQILDALNQVGLRLVNESGANSLAMIHAVATETGGMAMHNAIAQQRQMQMLSAASVTATCAKLLGMAGIVPAPAPPAPTPPAPPTPLPQMPIVNPFQPAARIPSASLLFPNPPSPPLATAALTALAITSTDLQFAAGTFEYDKVNITGTGLMLTFTPSDPSCQVLVIQQTKDGARSVLSTPPYTLSPSISSLTLTVTAPRMLPQSYVINFAS